MNDLDRIEKLFKMLGSDNDNEAATALRMIKSNLQKQGKSFTDFYNYLFGGEARKHRQYEERTERRQQEHKDKEEPRYYKAYDSHNNITYHEMGKQLLKVKTLNDWESDFVQSVFDKRLKEGKHITGKQRDVLVRIFFENVEATQ